MEICSKPFTYFTETTKSFAIVFSAFRINRTAFAAIQISSAQTVDSETLVSNPSPLSLSNLVKASSHDEVSNRKNLQ